MNTLWDADAYGGWSGVADQVAYWTVHVFLDNKSWPMFAFLFGLGFAMQMQRAEERGAPFLRTYTRRLAVLFLIGVAHDILTERDILWGFAIFGFLLLPLRKLNPNLLVVLTLIWLLVPFTRGAVFAHDHRLRLADLNSTRTEITVDIRVLDTYVGVYELATEPYTFFVTTEGNALYGQSPGYPGDADIPLRLFAESATEFFSRSSDLQVSFVKDSTETVTGLVLHESGRDAPARMIQRGPLAIDDNALRRVATQGPKAETYALGSFGQIASLRARVFREKIASYATSYIRWFSDTFALFLLGLYAGRRRIFHGVATHRQFIRRVMWWGLTLGLTGAAFATIMRGGSPFRGESVPFIIGALANLAETLGSPALGLGYVAALTLLLERDAWKRRLGPLGAVGRMALTNYLLQSVAFVLLFFGYGLGLFGKVGAFGGFMLTLPVFAFQIVASRWWLRHFRFGPVEWLWRSATYGKWQSMRLVRNS
ncbi:MAG TPA: DUF418 domain-containing protein [Gammaproteobacteria bacterium]|nr:DUF418 domain-containing protein [Gammaproteobacteria bacterium]